MKAYIALSFAQGHRSAFTDRAIGLGRRTREEIQKSGIKLSALRFQTGGRHQKSRPPFGGKGR